MQQIVAKIDGMQDRLCSLVIGDLNAPIEEFAGEEWTERFNEGRDFAQKTWLGDAYCARLMDKRISREPVDLDHIMLREGSAQTITTERIDPRYDQQRFSQEADSDHAGLKATITL